VAAVVRRRLAGRRDGIPAGSASIALPVAGVVGVAASSARPEAALPNLADETLKLHPSLALAMLRAGQTAAGRLWLMLRYLDGDGRGCLELAAIRPLLTRKESPTRLCGQRQLRALLRQGNGLFWQRDKTHVWLAGAAKAAAGLGVGRLEGNPIALPLAVLLEPIGLVRAHLYASFHSSRMGRFGGEGGPISRLALTAVSGVSRRTQHAYEKRAGVEVHPNIALGSLLSEQEAEETAWRHGRGAFVLTDRKGKQGKPGQRYLAWRLPNSYSGPHARMGGGRQRHLNRQLADLRAKGDAGNGRVVEEPVRRRYVANGALAAGCLRSQAAARVYWRGGFISGAAIWYSLSADVAGG
jgi:hypothetical protein